MIKAPETPKEVHIIDDPRTKLRISAFEAGQRNPGAQWWPELAPLRPIERELIKKAVREDLDNRNKERNQVPTVAQFTAGQTADITGQVQQAFRDTLVYGEGTIKVPTGA